MLRVLSFCCFKLRLLRAASTRLLRAVSTLRRVSSYSCSQLSGGMRWYACGRSLATWQMNPPPFPFRFPSPLLKSKPRVQARCRHQTGRCAERRAWAYRSTISLGAAAINKKDTSARAVADPSEQPSPGRSMAHLHSPLAPCSAPFFRERERNLMEKAVD